MNKNAKSRLASCLNIMRVQAFRYASTMFFRPRAQLNFSSRQRTDDERLLPAIELQDFPIDANSDASRSIYHTLESETSVLHGELQICHNETVSRSRLRRIAASLKLASCVDTLSHRLQPHSRGRWTVLGEGEESNCCDRVTTSPKTLLRTGQKKGHFWRANPGSESDTSWWSAVDWYFWSPTETVKNCPTLEFLQIHLAPPNVWL